MKKYTCLSLVSQFVMLLLLSKSSPAFAAPIQVIAPHTPMIQIHASTPERPEGQWHAPNNQHIGGYCTNRRIIRYFRGNNLTNSGNRGHNRGFNQDNSGNEGNQMINQGMMGKGQGHNQYYRNCITLDVHLYYLGNNQANSGNEKDNSGFSQDNSGNTGNQIVN